MKKAATITLAVAALSLAGAAQAQDAAKLASDKACLACHQIDKKLVGPAYKEVAKKYAATKGADAMLVKKIREGSNGVWGQIPMPPNTGVNEKEAAILAKWILSQK